jgi:subtilase family serine protease
MTPNEIRGAYGLGSYTNNILTNGLVFGNGVQGNGAGQTIALVDAYDDPTAFNDLNAFSTTFGLPTLAVAGTVGKPTFQKLNQGGTAVPLPSVQPSSPSSYDWEGEESLDIEWAHAMAPMANIILFEADNDAASPAGSPTNLLQAVQSAASTPGVVAISMSWGYPEYQAETTDDAVFATPPGHVGGAATLGGTGIAGGVTFLASSGDSGAYQQQSAVIGTNYPTSSPDVVSVGGTYLTVGGSNPNYTYGGESAWGNGSSSGFAGGGGGGISIYENQPSYQAGVAAPFSTTQRTYPDVCADADPNSGVDVYDSYDYNAATGAAGPWITVGGTSLASPLWAGMISLVDQDRAVNGQGSLDGPSQTLPILYGLPTSDYHDITNGDNGYAAGPGYDLASGIGSPVGNVLLPAASSSMLPTITVAAAANPNPVTGTTTNLTVSATESANLPLTYTWSATVPAGATPPTYSVNGTSTSNDTTATFSSAGDYIFTVKVTDTNGLSSSSSVDVVVDQTATSVEVSPNPVMVNVGANQQFTVVSLDQFGNTMSPAPTIAVGNWATTIGTITQHSALQNGGLFTAPALPGSGTVTASNVTVTVNGTASGPFSGSAAVTVTAPQFSISNAMVVGPTSGTTTVPVTVQLSGMGGTYTSGVTISYKTWDNTPSLPLGNNPAQPGAATGSADVNPSNVVDYESITNGTITLTPAQLNSNTQQIWSPVRLTANGNQYEYAVWQNEVVWVGSSGQTLFNNGSTTLALSPIGSDSQNPAIDGGYVIWSQLVGNFMQIFLYNQATGQTTQLTHDTFSDSVPQLYGTHATWCGNTFYGPAIFYDADLTNVSAPITAAGAAETGNTVTITTSSAESLAVGETVAITGVTVSGYNGQWMVTSVISPTQFTYTDTTPKLAASGGGTVIPEAAVQVSATGVDCYAPQISGTAGDVYVAWYGSHTTANQLYQDVYLYDANANQATALTNNLANQGQAQNESDQDVQIDGGNVVWQGTDGANCQIYLYQVVDGATTKLTNDQVDNVEPQISGSNIVWTKNCTVDTYLAGATIYWTPQVYTYSMNTGATIALTSANLAAGTAEYPQISGTQVVWRELVSADPVEWDVYNCNLSTPKVAPTDVSNSQGTDWYPLVSSTGTVVWSASDGTEFDIFTAKLAPLSITATINVTVFSSTLIQLDRNFFITATATLPSGMQSATSTVTILNDNGNLDFGSAPNPYPTALAIGGARNLIIPGEYLGTGEVSGQSSGVVFNTPMVPGSTATLTVTASMAGKLDAWIDFNDNGTWNDSGEEMLKDVSVVAGTNTLTFAVPAGALPGPTWARFRFSQAGGLAPAGMALDGEVEDYPVSIAQPPPQTTSGAGSVVLNASGNTVTATGSLGGSNVFTFTAGAASEVVTFNGKIQSYALSAIPLNSNGNRSFYVNFYGDGGQDSAILNGSTGSTMVSLQSASAGVSTMVDVLNATAAIAAAGATETGSTVTIATTTAETLAVGQSVTVAGVGVSGYNGKWTVASVINSTQFTFTDTTAGLAASGGGTVTSSTTVTVTLHNTPYILANGGGGSSDTAQLSDSSGTGTGTMRPNDATLAGGTTAANTAFSLEVVGFPVVHAYATKSGDAVNFVDVPSSVSTLVAAGQSIPVDQWTSKIGTSVFTNYAQGFTSCSAAVSNPADQAQLTDNQGQSTLQLTGTAGKLAANNNSYLIQVSGFQHIQVFGRVGGGDKATMSDPASTAASTLAAGPSASSFSGPGFNDAAYNFSSVFALAQSTADTATLTDAATSIGTLVDKPLDAYFFRTGSFSLEAKQFTTTTVISACPTDTANLYDLAGATNTLNATPGQVTFSGSNSSGVHFANTIKSFVQVTAFATPGNGDTANLTDLPGAVNTLSASPDQVTLSARTSGGALLFSDTAKFFSQVIASATAGNGDTAAFSDGIYSATFTSGWNTSVGGNLSTMTGNNSNGFKYNNQAKLFQHIQFNPTAPANHPVDQIFLTDSPGNDSLVATGSQAVGGVPAQSVDLSSIQNGYLYDILLQNIAGDTVTATDIAGGTDSKNVAAATDYVLKLVGAW